MPESERRRTDDRGFIHSSFKDPKFWWPVLVALVTIVVYAIDLRSDVDSTAAAAQNAAQDAKVAVDTANTNKTEVAVLKEQARRTENQLKNLDEKIDKILERLPKR